MTNFGGINPYSYSNVLSGSSGKIYVPVAANMVIYSQLEHISGFAASENQQGIAIDKVQILNRLIEQLSAMKHTQPKTVSHEWPVGVELTPRLGLEAGPAARAMSERIDDKLPGFIYEPESLGRNWNPRLYHRPGGTRVLPDGVPSVGDMQADVADDAESDPFASLNNTGVSNVSLSS